MPTTTVSQRRCADGVVLTALAAAYLALAVVLGRRSARAENGPAHGGGTSARRLAATRC